MKPRPHGLSALLAFVALAGCATVGPTRQQLENLTEVRALAPLGAFCFSGLTWDEQYVVQHVTPRFERFGIAPGDRIVQAHERPVSPLESGEWFAQWEREGQPGDTILLGLQRRGAMLTRTIECENGEPYATAVINVLEALTVGDMANCERAVSRAESFAGTSSYQARLRVSCREAYVRQEGNDGMGALAQAFYDYGRRVVEEGREAGTLQQRRAEVLGLVSELERAGFTRFAGDLSAQFDEPPPRSAPAPAVDEPTVSGGTCFAVRSDGTLMTAQHVVDGASEVRVWWQGTWFTAEVVTSSRTVDAAILRIPVPTVPFLPMASAASVESGARVFTFGYPVVSVLGDEAKFSEGSVASLSGLGGDQSLIQVSIPIQPGNSGGPVVTERGQVIGIIVSTAAVAEFLDVTGSLPQNVNWAVKTEAVSHLTSFEQSAQTLTRDAAIERASSAVCRVESLP